MAEEKPALHIDTDWKKQAQEEKRRLAEQEEQRRAAAPVAPAGVVAATAPAAPGRAPAPARPGRERQQIPPASFASLLQSIVTQALFYLGDIAVRGGEPAINLDMARHHIDTLGVLEQKTANNLTSEEKQMLDSALYEVRMRFISVAQQYAELP